MALSNKDLEEFSLYRRNVGSYVRNDSLPPLDQLFAGDTYYRVIFHEWPGAVAGLDQPTGHWTVLIRHSDSVFESFDSLGAAPTPEIYALLRESGLPEVTLQYSSRRLQSDSSVACGKWVMLRLQTLPHTLEEFLAFLDKINLPPEKVVNFLINVLV